MSTLSGFNQKTFRGKPILITGSGTESFINVLDLCRALGHKNNSALVARIAVHGEVTGKSQMRMASYWAVLGYAKRSSAYHRKPECGELLNWLLTEFGQKQPAIRPPYAVGDIDIAMAEVEAQLPATPKKRPVPEYLRIEIERAMAVLPSPD